MRLILDTPPFQNYPPQPRWDQRGEYPCRWVGLGEDIQPPFVAAYRLRFTMDRELTLRLHVTADERYELFLDGNRLGRGPERGDGRYWFFDTYEEILAPGEHLLAARTWALGACAPIAQFSLTPGFLLCPDDEALWNLLATGRAAWEVKRLEGYAFTPPMAAFGVGHQLEFDARQFPWGFERGEGEGWLPARPLHPGYSAFSNREVHPHEHTLAPAVLPAMLAEPRQLGRVRHISAPAATETHDIPILAENHLAAEESGWTALLKGKAELVIPPNTRRRVIVDLEDYYCAYPEVIVSGGEGGILRLHWQESLVENIQTWDKGHRGEVEGKYFTTLWWHRDGIGDLFHLDGGAHRSLETLWWRPGRYVEILVETSRQPLTIEQLRFCETRYPLEMESSFTASDPRLEQVIPLGVRALQMCSHETYMDCPYYEQLMYAGDTRLECLVTYVTTHDDRLPKKALLMFDISRLPCGLTQSRYPSRLRQIIPPFSLWWTAMIYDHLYWRGNQAFIRQRLPGMRAVLDYFLAQRNAAGLVASPPGWNFVDWAPAWNSGEPPGALEGQVCAPINWQVVYALSRAAQVEEACGEPELAQRFRRQGQELAAALAQTFWRPEAGLFADDLEGRIFSEHSQCLAILSGWLPADQRQAIAESLFTAPNLTRPTVYFLHYYFEACRELGRMDAILQRLESWFEMNALDFKTTYESANPHSNRSDCHAWGAHPVYHYFASFLGIRPASPGFAAVEIRPQLGSLQSASGRLVHPAGIIEVEFERKGEGVAGIVALPSGIGGVLRQPAIGDQPGASIPLRPGRNFIV